MVFIMNIYVDGGCRNNGYEGAYGAAAAVFKLKFGATKIWTRFLPSDYYDPPTNQRAEITAVILALEQALKKYQQLRHRPRLEVKIYSDSTYVLGCMTKWIYKWRNNGWINARGVDVGNKDLIQEAISWQNQLRDLGTVEYIWIPRAQNSDADAACNDAMDENGS